MYKSKSEREDERWMLEEDAIKRIKATGASDEVAREQLRKLKADFPAIVRVIHPPANLGPVTLSSVVVQPPQVLRSEIDKWWPADPPPPPGCVFIDAAVDQIKERLQISEGPAVKRLLDEVCSGEIRTWVQEWNGRRALPAQAWIGAHIDLGGFRDNRHSGICFGGTYYHLHYFLIAEDDFACRLNRSARPALSVPVVETAPAAVAVPAIEPALLREEKSAEVAPVAAKRRSNGLDHRDKDAPLVAEMRTLIETGNARSPEDAARAVVGRAVGYSTEASKVKRLSKHYRESQPSES